MDRILYTRVTTSGRTESARCFRSRVIHLREKGSLENVRAGPGYLTALGGGSVQAFSTIVRINGMMEWSYL